MSPDHRRKSIDSSDSDSSSSSDSDSCAQEDGKVKKDKKDKKDKKSKKDKMEHIGAPGFPQLTPPMPQPHFDQQRAAAPIQQAPSSGFRIPLHSVLCLPAAGSRWPAPMPRSRRIPGLHWLCHLRQICPSVQDRASSSYPLLGRLWRRRSGATRGVTISSRSPPDTMEFVRTSQGRVPAGRRPVEGGYEEDGTPLYHAVGVIDGVKVPGKTGAHL